MSLITRKPDNFSTRCLQLSMKHWSRSSSIQVQHLSNSICFLNDPCPTATILRIQSGKQYSRYKTDPRGESTRVPFTTLQSTLQHTIRTGVRQKKTTPRKTRRAVSFFTTWVPDDNLNRCSCNKNLPFWTDRARVGRCGGVHYGWQTSEHKLTTIKYTPATFLLVPKERYTDGTTFTSWTGPCRSSYNRGWSGWHPHEGGSLQQGHCADGPANGEKNSRAWQMQCCAYRMMY